MSHQFIKKRHIHQKTAADCSLASFAMFYNIPWETIKDIFTREVLYYKARLPDEDENDLNYYDLLFEEAFPRNIKDSTSISGLTYIDMYYLNTVINGRKNFVELPYLVLGIPCIITTFICIEGEIHGHDMYYDGGYVYDPAKPLSFYLEEKDSPDKITYYELKTIPPFGLCTYLFDDNSKIPKHLAAINKMIGHDDPNKRRTFQVISINDVNYFSSDNYKILLTNNLENVNEILPDNNKYTDKSVRKFIKDIYDRPYFNSNMADEQFVDYETFKKESEEYFKKIKEEELEKKIKDKSQKIKDNPQKIKVIYLPEKYYLKKYRIKENPITSNRTNEKLWEQVKKEAVKKMGGHSARAMQYAVKLYKDRGGKYLGKKRQDNDLATWTRAKWQYAPGSKSKDRYLPKEAWEKLSPSEERATRKKKKGKLGEWIPNTKKAKEAARKATARARRKA